MKKLFMVMAAAAFLTACNNSAENAADAKDSVDSAANAQIETIDSTADSKIEKIDSTADAKKDAMESTDTTKKN